MLLRAKHKSIVIITVENEAEKLVASSAVSLAVCRLENCLIPVARFVCKRPDSG